MCKPKVPDQTAPRARFVAHENSTFRTLAIAVSGSFMALMGALFDLKCVCDSTLVYVYQADAEKCYFVTDSPAHYSGNV